MIDWILPIGSVIANANPLFNPNLLYRNMTWERFAKGQTLVGVNEDDEDFSAADKTGGEKEHVLTVAEMPDHGHRIRYRSGATSDYLGGSAADYGLAYEGQTSSGAYSGVMNNTGGDEPHNNMPPYVTVYYWRRIA